MGHAKRKLIVLTSLAFHIMVTILIMYTVNVKLLIPATCIYILTSLGDFHALKRYACEGGKDSDL